MNTQPTAHLPHICLGTNQPLPNLTPLAGGHIAPNCLYIVTPPERQQHSRWLANAVARLNPSLRTTLVNIDDAYDLAQAVRTMQQLADAHPEGCTVNVTGGSKLLTLAAWQTLRRPQDRIFYVRPNDDALAWLHPTTGREPIRDVLTLPLWLAVFGLEPMPEAPPSRPDRNALKAEAKAILHRIQQIARAAQLADTDRWQRIKIKKLSSHAGYWLEDYVSGELVKLFAEAPEHRRRLQDLSGPFKVRLIDEPKVINELDGAILYNNRLTLIEAKNGNAAEGESAAEAIYKLGMLRNRLGGWISQGVFISARLVSHDIQTRAQQYGITVIDARNLGTLRQTLEKILMQPNGI